MSDTRHLCTECWTEGEGSAPKACPACGAVGAWFVTANHGGQPLKEVLAGLFSGYQVPSELEDVLEKPSDSARLDDELFAGLARIHISNRFREQGRGVPEDDIEILDWGAEGGIKFRIRSTDEEGVHDPDSTQRAELNLEILRGLAPTEDDERQAAELREAVATILDESSPDYEHQILLKYAADRLRFDPDIPEGADLEVLAVVPIFWSGWEGDSGACLYRLLPDGKPQLHVFEGVHVRPDRLADVLRKRVAAYEQLAKRTREFLVHMGADYPPDAAEVLKGMEPVRKRPKDG